LFKLESCNVSYLLTVHVNDPLVSQLLASASVISFIHTIQQFILHAYSLVACALYVLF